MVLAFHDREGLIYTNMVPRGTTVNAVYIISALKVFLKRMKQKRPLKKEAVFILHWNNAPCASSGTLWPPRRRSR